MGPGTGDRAGRGERGRQVHLGRRTGRSVRLDVRGGSANARGMLAVDAADASVAAAAGPLAGARRVLRGPGAARWGFFLRAETMHTVPRPAPDPVGGQWPEARLDTCSRLYSRPRVEFQWCFAPGRRCSGSRECCAPAMGVCPAVGACRPEEAGWGSRRPAPCRLIPPALSVRGRLSMN